MTEQEIIKQFPYEARRKDRKKVRYDLEPYEFEIHPRLIVALCIGFVIAIIMVTVLARHINSEMF